jgi:hypothetical protein
MAVGWDACGSGDADQIARIQKMLRELANHRNEFTRVDQRLRHQGRGHQSGARAISASAGTPAGEARVNNRRSRSRRQGTHHARVVIKGTH